MIQNIVQRLGLLVSEYRNILKEKAKIMESVFKCVDKIDKMKCPIDLSKPLEQMTESELKLLVQT